ncbi:helix-turn-helix DNA binding domain protein [Streptomyces phage Attoomi]|uniref:Helix-turn-helix DNA binding domain protein n=1 Tax=Streptomyces phage Attoomi TaxID=2059881 RepID=A0A2H5BLM0_9CAUD|nr:helix-turn-helix DNA binding domain protein [Streptomyces phage Attoomi]AUG87181.1 helix-turn-helix DNA binding domain protein [Streptomyces phage Attoomi]
MRIHRTRHDRDFTVVPNRTARNRKLSFTARGLWLHLISLPDGAKEDVRTLADNNPGVGRKGVANALDELVAAGYYFRFTIKDPETGRIWTETALYDLPQTEESPVPASPATGRPGNAETGTLPTGVKDLVSKDLKKEPSLPSVSPVQTPAAPAAREGSSKTDQEIPTDPEAVRVLGRLEDVDARLRLSGRQLRDLAPLAAEWLSRGYSATEITDAVVQGLPGKVYAPAKIVADRLTRKLPAPRRKWRTFADCSDGCGRLLPAGQDSGKCGVCAGTTPAPFLQELAAQAVQELAPADYTAPDVRAHVSNLRALMRPRRSVATA